MVIRLIAGVKMMCSCCGQEVEEKLLCGVQSCDNEAEFEGWYDSVDGFGIPTGYSRVVRVCKEHKHVLRGHSYDSKM
jgi:hypothetical protein